MEWLSVDSDTGMLYGTVGVGGENASGYLLAINEHTGKVIANTSLAAYPLSVTLDAKDDMLYVGACQQIALACGGAEVLMVNGTTNEIQGRVLLPFDGLNFPVVVDQTTGTVYAMGLGSNLTFLAFNGRTGGVEFTSNYGGSCAGAGGGAISVNEQTDQLYVSFDSQPLFLVLNGANGQITSMFSTQNDIQDVVFSPVTNQIYVTMSTSLVVLPGSLETHYVNYGLLSEGLCLP